MFPLDRRYCGILGSGIIIGSMIHRLLLRPLTFRRCHQNVLRHSSSAPKFTSTLNLPESNFPMKHSRKLELDVEKSVKFEDIFRNESLLPLNEFILHDGPPYANGDAHFGHAINRILKDIIVKRKSLENYNVDYRPGWDCHGLPIELKAIPENISGLNESVSPLEIRKRARQLAFHTIQRQKSTFKQWLISADWNRCYQTFDVEYCIAELRAFYELYRKGLIFRDRMPVYWSPSTGTALAEAELQYKHDHLSLSAFIRYPVISHENYHFDALIWTTTPWTLLANEAIAYSERMNYCLVKIDSHNFEKPILLARENIPVLQETLKNYQIKVVEEVSVADLKNCRYKDPITGEIRPFLASVHVSTTKGTGLIHIAPDHGQEDYKLMQQYMKDKHKHNDHILKKTRHQESIVDEQGQLRLPNGERLSIIDNNDASRFVIEELWPKQYVLHEHYYEHSYPYDWRTDKPVIIRSSNQWFLDIEQIRNECIHALNDVQFYPEKLRKEMINQLIRRPNWCLSRQRRYGVPIPVFYHRETSLTILNDDIFETLMNKFQTQTLDVWWKETPKELLSNCKHQIEPIDPESLVKGNDILDIWFDSGCSWLAVLNEPNKMADVYLEGVDQLRGWFQSSLITSVALRNRAPYRAIFIHGFALDSSGKKMSKSMGNVIDPMDIVQARLPLTKTTGKNRNIGDCGVDGLRLWVAKNACTHNDVHVDINDFSENILSILNRFRNTFRFILGYLTKSSSSESNLLKEEHYDQLAMLDKYLLYKLLCFHLKANEFYREYAFGSFIEYLIHHFNYEWSTFYLTRIKDRLYCNHRDSIEVRSIITLFYHCYHTISYHMAPIMPHLAMECHRILPLEQKGILHFQTPESLVKKLFPNDQLALSDFQKSLQLIHLLIKTLNNTKYDRLIEFDCKILFPSKKTLGDHPEVEELLRTFYLFCSNADESVHWDLIECLQTATVSFASEDNDENLNLESYTDCLEISEVNFKKSQRNSLFSDSDDEMISSEDESNLKSSQEESEAILLRILLRPTTNKQCIRCKRFTIVNLDDKLCLRCSAIIY